MGLKTTDLVPLAPGPTVLIPTSKDVVVKAFQVLRTDTVASLKAQLPADATVVDILIFGVASDAATTANVSIGTNSTATQWVNAQDVKTAGGLIRPTSTVSAANLPNTENVPLGTDIQVWAKYAETGTPSTVGGPYTVLIFYIR